MRLLLIADVEENRRDIQISFIKRGQIIKDTQERIITFEKQAQQFEKIILSRDQTVSQKDNVIMQKDRALCDANEITTEKEQIITSLRDEVSLKEELFRERYKALRETANSIARKEREIHRYREELFSIYTSRSWRYMLPFRKVGSLVRWILTFPHHSRIRTIIKHVYFILPAFIRNSKSIEKLKNRFKETEIMV